MKRLILFATLLILIFNLSAQIEKGSVLVGGNAGFQFNTSTEKNTEFVFSLAPAALYHPIKYIGIGGQLSYAYDYDKVGSAQPVVVSAQNSFGIGPVVRVNIPVSKKTFFFFHNGFTGGVNVVRDPTDRSKAYTYSSIITWRFGPGFSIFVTRNVAVELGFYYDGRKYVDAIKQDNNVLISPSTTFVHGLTIAVGLQFYAHKKRKTAAQNP